MINEKSERESEKASMVKAFLLPTEEMRFTRESSFFIKPADGRKHFCFCSPIREQVALFTILKYELMKSGLVGAKWNALFVCIVENVLFKF